MVKPRKGDGARSSRGTVIELSDDDCVLDISCPDDIEIVELGRNTPSQVVTSQSYDSGVEFASQVSVDGGSQDISDLTTVPTESVELSSQESDKTADPIDITDSAASQDSQDVIVLDVESAVNAQDSNSDSKKRLLQLEEEIQQLKAENEALKSSTCSCQTIKDAIITIRFDSLNSFNTYQEAICKLFKECIDLELDERKDDLLIRIYKDGTINRNEWVVLDELEVTLPLDKRKKRRKRKISVEESESLNDTFVLDTTPSLSTNKNNLRYESKFDIASAINKGADEVPKAGSGTCFNCDGSHNLRDCPHPKDYAKIQLARQKFKPQNKSTVYRRYHLDCDQKFEDFKPGQISTKLQEALGIRHYQLPEYIYRMRKLGYPPGWFSEIVDSRDSNLVLFDFNGKGAEEQKKMVPDLDMNQIIDYHGFNIPLRKGFKDEHRLYDSPPYSKELSKSKMKAFLDQYTKDNLNSCEMEVDHVASDKEVEVINVLKDDKAEPVKKTSSPTLDELEIKKKKLLDQLTEDVGSNSVSESKIDTDTTIDNFVTLDETGPDATAEAGELDDSTIEKQCESPILKTIKTSYFGTPLIKGASPYSRLPHCDNFTKNVSDVINFENLPNSTGKYDQMVVVIEKVRRSLNNKKS
uniref:PSP proline-rich domain-containing protein n=1 Tax=Photinus pyralis TaxID=7054 RepID=A0A1Y1N711_PHOPY